MIFQILYAESLNWNNFIRIYSITLYFVFNRLIVAENDAQIEQLLQDNSDLVTVRLVQFMEDTQAKMRKDGEEENAERLAQVLEKVRGMV